MSVVSRPAEAWWLDVAARSESATFFHTPIWSQIAVSALDAVDRTLGFTFSDGVRAVLPIAEVGRHRRRPVLVSTAAGCYGGPIATQPLNERHRRVMRHRLLALGYHTFECLDSPLPVSNSQPAPLDLGLRGTKTRSESAWFIDLDGEFETVFGRVQPRLRTKYRSGVRRGVRVESSTGIDDYRAHFDAYRDAVRRWNGGPDYGYGWPVFEKVREIGLRFPDHIRLWVARVDGDTVGGRIVFYWGRHAVLWNGSVRSEYLKDHVLPVLDIEIARDACNRGMRTYDLNTTGDLPGVIDYKRRLGGREVPLLYRSHEQLPFRLVRSTRRRVGR